MVTRGFREAMCGALRILAMRHRRSVRHRPWVILRWIANRSEATWRVENPGLFVETKGGGRG